MATQVSNKPPPEKPTHVLWVTFLKCKRPSVKGEISSLGDTPSFMDFITFLSLEVNVAILQAIRGVVNL